jgi:hypothetical protein
MTTTTDNGKSTTNGNGNGTCRGATPRLLSPDPSAAVERSALLLAAGVSP